MQCKYVITDCVDSYTNLALEQYLMSYVENGFYILYLWQNDDTIVIGRNQDLYKECKVEEFLESGGHIARRKSGGGAVYHDLGNLNYSIITTENDSKKLSYHTLVANVLKTINIQVDFNYRNDLTCHGKKISGNAVYSENNIVCQHGTILISSNIERMTRFLTPEKSKLERNYVKSVDSRVINLSELSDGITVNQVKNAFVESLKGEPLEYKKDINEISILTQFYSSNNWVYRGER